MANDLSHAKLTNKQPALNTPNRETARELFERSLHLDIFNVGSVMDSAASE